MKITIRKAIAGLLVLGTSQVSSFALVTDYVEAIGNATVQVAGVRSGANGLAFFNVEGSGNGSYATFGVIDFSIAALTIPAGQMLASVNALSFQLTQSNAAFSVAGGLNFYLTTDTTTSILTGSSPLTFQSADSPGGVNGQLDDMYLLGSGSYDGTYSPNTSGTVDTFNLSLDGMDPVGMSYLTSLLTTGGTLRVVVTGDEMTAATYAGYTNGTYGGPQVSVDYTLAAVPEPSTVVLITLAGGFLFWRLSRSRRAVSPL